MILRSGCRDRVDLLTLIFLSLINNFFSISLLMFFFHNSSVIFPLHRFSIEMLLSMECNKVRHNPELPVHTGCVRIGVHNIRADKAA